MDMRLDWTDAGDASLTVVHAPPAEGGPHHVAALSPPARDTQDVAPAPDSDLDTFQSIRERDQAIEAALDHMAEEPMSVVAGQVSALRRALQAGPLPESEKLISEVERFVETTAARIRGQAPVEHPGMREARGEMLQALGLYTEVCGLLRALADTPDASAAALCARLEGEAAHGLLRARDLLVSCHPA